VESSGVRHTLCKDERLSRRKIIESLHQAGSAIKSPAIILVYLPCELPVEFPAQAMFSASKRLFKRAHDRNRVKRLLREAYRKQKHVVYTSLKDRSQQYALHFIFTGKQLPNHAYVFGKMNDLILRFCNETSHVQAPKNPTIKE
jgi:ribonuclease P protein component